MDELFGAGVRDLWTKTGKATSENKRPRKRRTSLTNASNLPPALSKLLGEAELHYIHGEYKSAIQILQKIIPQAPKLSEVYNLLGLIYEAWKQHEVALQLYIIAANYGRKNIPLWDKVFNISYRNRNYEVAYMALNHLISKKKNNEWESTDLRMKRIYCALQINRIPGARKQFQLLQGITLSSATSTAAAASSSSTTAPVAATAMTGVTAAMALEVEYGDMLLEVGYEDDALYCYLKFLFFYYGIKNISSTELYPSTIFQEKVLIQHPYGITATHQVLDLIPELCYALRQAVEVSLQIKEIILYHHHYHDTTPAAGGGGGGAAGGDAAGDGVASGHHVYISSMTNQYQQQQCHIVIDMAINCIEQMIEYMQVLRSTLPPDASDQDLKLFELPINLIVVYGICKLSLRLDKEVDIALLLLRHVFSMIDSGEIYSLIIEEGDSPSDDTWFLLKQLIRIAEELYAVGVHSRSERLLQFVVTILTHIQTTVTSSLTSTTSAAIAAVNKTIIDDEIKRKELSKLWNRVGEAYITAHAHHTIILKAFEASLQLHPKSLLALHRYSYFLRSYCPRDKNNDNEYQFIFHLIDSYCESLHEEFNLWLKQTHSMNTSSTEPTEHQQEQQQQQHEQEEEQLQQEQQQLEQEEEEEVEEENDDDKGSGDEESDDEMKYELDNDSEDGKDDDIQLQQDIVHWIEETNDTNTVLTNSTENVSNQYRQERVLPPKMRQSFYRRPGFSSSLFTHIDLFNLMLIIREWGFYYYYQSDYLKCCAIFLPILEAWCGRNKTIKSISTATANYHIDGYASSTTTRRSGKKYRNRSRIIMNMYTIATSIAAKQKFHQIIWLSEELNSIVRFVSSCCTTISLEYVYGMNQLQQMAEIIVKLLNNHVDTSHKLSEELLRKCHERIMKSTSTSQYEQSINEMMAGDGSRRGNDIEEHIDTPSAAAASSAAVTAAVPMVVEDDSSDDEDRNHLQQQQQIQSSNKKSHHAVHLFNTSSLITWNRFRRSRRYIKEDILFLEAKSYSDEVYQLTYQLLNHSENIFILNQLYEELIKYCNIFTENNSPENILSFQRFFILKPIKNVIFCILKGHYYSKEKKRNLAIDHYLEAFYYNNQQPLIALCLCSYYFMMCQLQNCKNRLEFCYKGITFLYQYQQLRQKSIPIKIIKFMDKFFMNIEDDEVIDVTIEAAATAAAAADAAAADAGGEVKTEAATAAAAGGAAAADAGGGGEVTTEAVAAADAAGGAGGEVTTEAAAAAYGLMKEMNPLYVGIYQETLYNMGRSFHDLHLYDLAAKQYEKVLKLAEVFPILQENHQISVTREAAHNLIQIYKRSDSMDLAYEIMMKFLTI